jgi:hypothetical protein
MDWFAVKPKGARWIGSPSSPKAQDGLVRRQAQGREMDWFAVKPEGRKIGAAGDMGDTLARRHG